MSDVSADPSDFETVRFQAALLDSVGQAVIATDVAGIVVYWNRAAEQLYGWAAREAVGRPLFELIPAPQSPEEGIRIFAELAAGHSWSGEFVVGHRDGTAFPVQVTNTPVLGADGTLQAIIGISTDITERKRAEQAVRHLSAIVESSTDAIIGETLDGTILSWNSGAERLYGYAAHEAIGQNIRILADSPAIDEEIADLRRRVALGQRVQGVETVRRHKDGSLVDVSLAISPVYDDDGSMSGFSTIARDDSGRKEAERALIHQGLHDALTGLPNRALLADRLEQALAAAGRVRRRVAVAFVALDQFKRVNDNFGHAAGDAVLIEVATRLALRMREGDTLARFSGDEFVMVWGDLPLAEDAMALSERLAQAFEGAFLLDGAQLSMTASIGVSSDQWAQTADELILAADAAMQEAKRRGRGLVRFFTPELRERASSSMRTGLGLRAALDRNELVLHYQPVVDLARSAVVGVEALIRWQHPTDGLIGPDLFIPVAEAEGMIVELGEWVLEQAAGQAVRWYDDGIRLDMAVNVSTRQVADPSLVPALARVVQESGIDPRHLVLEVTESAVMEDADAAAEVFDAITALGVSLAIDDFGTGYSSLVYLKRYRIAALKIDRSFTAGMGVFAEDDAIVASVIGLARAVGGFCIAEGIETPEQYRALRSLNCGFGQGWLFGRAVAAEDLPDLILACEAKLAALELTMPTENGEARDQIADQRDQTADERDQTADERDQTADERDQTADERDQMADERDKSGDERDDAADERDHSGDERDQSGDERDHAADEREQSGDEREQSGDEREAADQSDLTDTRLVAEGQAGFVSRPALVRREAASGRTRASHDRRAGESERGRAGLGRGSALAARGVNASARTLAEVGRDNSLADRGASTRSRNTAAHERDVYLPAAELVQLEREIARARRNEMPLVLAFIDVDRLKVVNYSRSHPAGDRMLLEVAHALGAKVRSYDLILRPGGDGFVWALSGLDLHRVTKRLAMVNTALEESPQPGLVRFGLAELLPGDSPRDLVERASAALHLTTP